VGEKLVCVWLCVYVYCTLHVALPPSLPPSFPWLLTLRDQHDAHRQAALFV